ncbi:MAG: VIT1/CCC1 transporter family protein [Nocardioides sp.]
MTKDREVVDSVDPASERGSTPEADPLPAPGPHEHEPHQRSLGARLNWLRAGVLGANDGIVSTAGIVMGVAGATTNGTTILIAGVAGLVAGAMSMAAGEYVSVSTQRDSERAMLALEQRELDEMPQAELAELADMWFHRGLNRELALEVATELTAHDALAAHADIEFGIDPDELTNPWHAAWASMVSFALGALIPLLSITLASPAARVYLTVASVVVALALAGWLSARLGSSAPARAMVRNVVGGLLAMGVTFAIGALVGTSID